MLSLTPLRLACWATRSFHTFPGRWRVVRYATNRFDQLAKLRPRTVAIGSGRRMTIEPGDSQGRPIYMFGYNLRDALHKVFERIIGPGDCVLDVGASFGYYTIVASELVGPRGCVHAFEASPRILKYTRENVRLSPIANITLHECAVSDRGGEATFHVATSGLSGLSSLRPIGPDESDSTQVATIAIDTLLDRIPTTRLVKIDIEGAEFLAIQGMQKLIDRDRPYLIIEVTDAWYREFGVSAAELWAFLEERGYRSYELLPDGLEELTGVLEHQGNILSIPQDVPESELRSMMRPAARTGSQTRQ